MEPQKDDWSTYILVAGAVVGGLTGFFLVMLLKAVLGPVWGIIASIVLLIAVGFLGYKVLIE